MALNKFNHVKIKAIQAVLPKNIKNIDDEKQYYKDEFRFERFKKILGLGTRRVIDDKTTCCDLLEFAAIKLIEKEKLDKDTIDTLIVVSTSHDFRSPASSCILQGRLGLTEDCTCFDLSGLGCSAYVHGLYTAHSLIASGVSKRLLLLVGDTNQLQPVTVIEENVNADLMKQYDIGEEYNYIHNSILSTMLKKDNNSKNVLLRYHYRCGQKIVSFVNQRFYNNQLKLLNNEKGDLIYFNVKNNSFKTNKNSFIEEANEVVKIIKENNYKDVGIITPFVNQAALINYCLAKEGITDTKAGTIHTLQGSEKSVIIMSAALSYKTGKKTMDWIKNNHELINVGVTRAKDKFIFVGDKEAIDKLSGNETNDIKVLSDYIYKNGEIEVPKSDTIISYDFSNDSKNEKDFFDTIKPYFNRRGSKFRIERNVPIKEAIKNIRPNDERFIGKKEFDVIVQVTGRIFKKKYHTIVAFEIDGGEHVINKKTIAFDRQKEETCKFYGIKLIRIPNSAVKDYESIISLFEYVVKDLRDLDEAYDQSCLLLEE